MGQLRENSFTANLQADVVMSSSSSDQDHEIASKVSPADLNSSNETDIYRHLATLEKRGLVESVSLSVSWF